MREHSASEIRSGAPDGIWLRRLALKPCHGLLCGRISFRGHLLKYPQDPKSVIEGAAFLV
jgi:hypothetical protein